MAFARVRRHGLRASLNALPHVPDVLLAIRGVTSVTLPAPFPKSARCAIIRASTSGPNRRRSKTHRSEPDAARITLTARGSQGDAPVACSVDWARDPGGRGACRRRRPGTAACSGDLLLGALAACAQVTCQMVATAMGIETDRIEVVVDGDLDLRGTLGVSREAPVGFERIRLRFEIDAPGATPSSSPIW